MKLLFENWRKYVNESTEPDHLSDKAELAVHPEANVGQPEDDDNQKLIDIFWGSGVQALQLAEMTGNEEMLSVFKPIVADTKSFIQWIDKQVAWAQGKEPSMSRGPGDDIFMSGPEIINNKANKKAAHSACTAWDWVSKHDLSPASRSEIEGRKILLIWFMKLAIIFGPMAHPLLRIT